MRLQVTLLLLFGSFLKGFCLVSVEKAEDFCDIKITDFNTYEITCPRPAKEAKESTTENGAERSTTENGAEKSTTENGAEKSENLCCRLYKNKADGSDWELNAWSNGEGQSYCEPKKSTDDFHRKMVKNNSTEGNSCKVTIESQVKDKDDQFIDNFKWKLSVKKGDQANYSAYEFDVFPKNCTPVQALEQEGYLLDYAVKNGGIKGFDDEDSILQFQKECHDDEDCNFYAISDKGDTPGVGRYKRTKYTHFCQSPGSLVIQKDNPAYFNNQCDAHFPNNTCSMANTWIPSVEYTEVDDLSQCSDKCSDNGYFSYVQLDKNLKKCGILNQIVESNNVTFCTLSGYTTYSKKWERANCKQIARMYPFLQGDQASFGCHK